MGKGDKKTRRGKITQGSYGKTRPKKSASKMLVVKEVKAKPVKEKASKPAEPKVEKPKKAAKSTEVTAEVEEKPKTTRKKKTEE